jgi:hypothetical protein
VGQPVEHLAGEVEVLGENLYPCRIVHHKFHKTWPVSNPGRRGSEAGE